MFHLPADEVLDLLDVRADRGLDRFEVAHRRERFGANVLTEKRGRGPLLRFLLQFHQPLVYILLAAVAVTLLFAEYLDAAVIFAVVLANAAIGFVQESKALRAIHALAKSLTSEATVLRAGRRERIPAADIVPGDIAFLESGDKVPADLRLLEVRDLQVNESALTGESVPVEKEAAVLERDLPLADRRNMAYSSTFVTYGRATGVAVATGDSTEIGRISQLIASAEVIETPLSKKIHAFSNLLLWAILGLAAVAFLTGVLYGNGAFDMFLASVAIAVGAIPEGLPAAVTIILAAGVARMAQRRAIIRKLPAVETLGSTTVICSDKTGTLTQNEMTVQAILAGGKAYEVSGAGWSPEGEISSGGARVDPAAEPALLECLRAGALANDADVRLEDGRWKVQGDPTEAALVVAARKAGLEPEALREGLPRLDAIPFESHHQYMATLHDLGSGKPRVAYLKGSLERALERCRAALGAAGEEALEADAVRFAADELAARGLRVLALARKEFPPETRRIHVEDLAGGMVFLGLQAMMDPPRPEAEAAVRACRAAGVGVKMITGDHAVTAAAIARAIGIGTDGAEAPAAIAGRELDTLSDDELIEAAGRYDVFARVSPENKLRLVEALQARGEIVAMTGDGVNDAPALRRADIGVAMGISGTEVAREAADMVLTDDNFATIEAAVEEGRGVFDNLRKFLVWTLPTNGGECLSLLAAILLGMPLPILPIQLLWINMGTSVTLGLTLAFEPKEPGLMNRPPHDPKLPILDRVLGARIALVSVLISAAVIAVFEFELARGSDVARARTAATAAVVFAEATYLFNCRSLERSFVSVGLFSNPWTWAGAGLMTAAQIAFTHAPFMNRLFGSAPLDAVSWAVVAALSLAVSFAVGGEKVLRRRLGRRGRGLAIALGVAALFVPAEAGAAAPSETRPNVVLVVADDLGWSDLSSYGSDFHRTPRLDALAREGIRFTSAYAAAPVCTPTRAALMTGKCPARLHMTIWYEAARSPPETEKLLPPIAVGNLPHEEVTAAEALRSAGYQAIHVGKWHLGEATHYPETQGFDVNVGGTLWGAPPTYFYPYRGPFGSSRELRYVPRLEWGEEGEYLTDRLTDEALRAVERAGTRPFFLHLAHHAVHTPIEGKPAAVARWAAEVERSSRHRNPAYAAMLESLDESVGRLLDKLDALGIAERTVVIFTSDNGGHVGEYGGRTVTTNHPLRSGKGSLYEGGIRVPLIVRWPGVVSAGGVSDEPVISNDLFFTILEIAGVEPAARGGVPADGRSLVPILKDPRAKLGREALFWHYPHYYATTTPVSAVRSGDWKLLEYYEDGRVELYNLAGDLGETRDLASREPERAASLRAALRAWLRSVGAQMPAVRERS